MRISDWSSDVCSSDLTSIEEIGSQVSQSTRIVRQAVDEAQRTDTIIRTLAEAAHKICEIVDFINNIAGQTNLLALNATIEARSEEHTSELQSLMRISYAVFCLKKKTL